MCGAFSSDKLLITMNKLVILITLLFTSTFMVKVGAVGLDEVKLESISTSGKSLLIDRGVLEGFEEGLFARFFIQKGPKEFPKIFLVAEGELVKSFPRKSYWILKKIYIPDVILAKSKLLIFTSNTVTLGRPLKLRNHHVVLSKSNGIDVDSYLKENKKNTPARLVKEGGDFEPSPDIFEEDELKYLGSGTDVLLTTYENYTIKEGKYFSEEFGDETLQKYFIGNKEIDLGDIKNVEDKKLFDSMADNYVKKTNSMKYGIKSFYSEVEKIKEMPDVSVKGTLASSYDEAKNNEKESDHISPVAIAKVHRDGDQWSSDMDDVSLRRYFIKTGLEKEARRRELALNELDGHELILSFSNALVAHANTDDPNYQGLGSYFSISYDLHLSRTSPNLKNWSLQFIYEKGINEFDSGFYNVRATESGYGAYINYYFINNPLTLHSFIFLTGFGIKTGSSNVYSPELIKKYTYQALSLPSLQVMTKYRFRTGDLNEDTVNVGASLNFGINFDAKNLSLIDSVDDEIASKISFYDLKYTVGLSLFF